MFNKILIIGIILVLVVEGFVQNICSNEFFDEERIKTFGGK